MAQNILEIDVAARVHALRCLEERHKTNMSIMLPSSSVADLACLCLFDFESAFLSMIHGWIFFVLAAIGAPAGLVSVLRGLYADANAYAQVEGKL